MCVRLLFLSNRLVSSVKNNVGRGLNVALVNGKQLLTDCCIKCWGILISHCCFISPGVTGELLETKTFDMWAGGNKNQTVVCTMNFTSGSEYGEGVTTTKPQLKCYLMFIYRCFWPVEISPAASWGNPCVCCFFWWCSYKVRFHNPVHVFNRIMISWT